MNDEHGTLKERYPRSHALVVGLIWLLVLGLLVWICYGAGWTNQWYDWVQERCPNHDMSWMINPAYVKKDTSEPESETPTEPSVPPEQPSQQQVEPTQPPQVEPTAPPQFTAPPTVPPTAPPTAQPTEVPATPTPAVHATYTLDKEISVYVNGEKVVFRTFSYSGGYIPADDPWFVSEEKKETKDSYGASIYGKTPAELAYNWLRELCKSPHQIIRLRTQMGMISPKSLREENLLAIELANKSVKDYDAVVNETLKFFFKKLKDGRIEQSTDWDLENYMILAEGPDETSELELHGRLNHDDDAEKKDILLTFYAKGAKRTFVSASRGYKNTVSDAKASGNFSERAWVNMTEGGTWKWKAKGGGTSTTTKPPVITTPPTSTPVTTTPAPATPTPTPTSQPTKRPEDRPTEGPGTGGTDPEHSADPHTTDHVESTPAPANTATPAPTAAPTAVPTAEVRPTEQCETVAPTPIREDIEATPAPTSHPVQTQEPITSQDGDNDDSFDPGSI